MSYAVQGSTFHTLFRMGFRAITRLPAKDIPAGFWLISQSLF